MPTPLAVPAVLRNRLRLALTVVAVALALAGPAMSVAAPAPSVLTFKTVKVGAPGNPSVGIVPFTDAIYRSCAEVVPAEKQPPCQQVGGVDYRYGIGQLEVTVAQYVAFLNTVDPAGRNRHKLYSSNESSSAWPKYGQIDFSAERRPRAATTRWPRRNGPTSPTASPTSCARPASSTRSTTARLLSKKASSDGSFQLRHLPGPALAPDREGDVRHDRSGRRPARTRRGFVVPSQDEWIKAAYYDPNGGGTYSYWKYPTNPGVFGDEGASAPHADDARPDDRRRHQRLDPAAGDLPHRRSSRPRAGARRLQRRSLRDRQPVRDRPDHLRKGLPGQPRHGRPGEDHLAVGHARPGRQRGRVDRHDHPAAVRGAAAPGRVWRRLHGGIANAPVYQLWLSAVGLQPQDNTFYTATYPWLGIRIGVLGDLKVGKR